MFQLDILFQLFHHWCINVSNESSICSGTISFLRWLVFYKQWVVSCFLCYEALGFVLFHAHWASFHFFFFLLYWVTFSHGIPPFSCVYLPADCSIYLLFAINVHCCFPLNFFLWAKSPVCVPTSLFSWPSLDFFVSFYYMLAAILFSRFFENFKIFWRILMTKSFYLVTGQHLAWKKKIKN